MWHLADEQAGTVDGNMRIYSKEGLLKHDGMNGVTYVAYEAGSMTYHSAITGEQGSTILNIIPVMI
jgi:hypothetical protein